MNNCTFIGRFVADPVLSRTPNGIDVCNFIIAVSRPWNSKKTDFIPVVVWRNNAVFINKHFHKGDQIGLKGYITIDVYEKDGIRQARPRLVADDIHPIWRQKVATEKIKEDKESNAETNADELQSETNSENIINGDDLSVILGSIPEYDIFENPESIDYAYFDELYDGAGNL